MLSVPHIYLKQNSPNPSTVAVPALSFTAVRNETWKCLAETAVPKMRWLHQDTWGWLVSALE
jgi:hypothetical protein